MSHVVTIVTEVRDAAAVAAACMRLRLPEPAREKVQLFEGNVEGLAVRLPGWRYPVVCDVDSGTVRFDDFGGRWGDRKQLDNFLQGYAAEKVKLEARKAGYSVRERQQADGSIRLTVGVGG